MWHIGSSDVLHLTLTFVRVIPQRNNTSSHSKSSCVDRVRRCAAASKLPSTVLVWCRTTLLCPHSPELSRDPALSVTVSRDGVHMCAAAYRQTSQLITLLPSSPRDLMQAPGSAAKHQPSDSAPPCALLHKQSCGVRASNHFFTHASSTNKRDPFLFIYIPQPAAQATRG